MRVPAWLLRAGLAWLLAGIAAPGFAASVAGGGAGDASKLVDDPIYLRAAQLVYVEPGRRLNLRCSGRGSPAVILESGQGGDSSAWALVQPIVARRTTVCSYDRAGLGFSDPIRRPSTAGNLVDDLHRLLAAAKIRPPYVLVGHSLGGMFVRLYADEHFDEVAGLVLVDPSHEDQRIRFRAIAAKPKSRQEWDDDMQKFYAKRRACIADATPDGIASGAPMFEQCVDPPSRHYSEALNAAQAKRQGKVPFLAADLSEMEHMFDDSAEQMRSARRSYGDLPLLLLASAPRARGETETEQHHADVRRVQDELNADLARLSTRGTVRMVPDSTHQIQLDQPQAVADAIFEVMAEAAPRRP